MSRTYTGIDIGSNSLKMALCDGSVIRKLAVEQLPENLVRDGRIASPSAMSAFIRDTAKKYGIRAKKCALILPSADGACFTRRFTLPLMSVEQLKLNLPYEFRDYITQGQEKYVYDYAVLERVPASDEHPSEELDILGAAALSESVEDYRDILRRSGFNLTIALPEEFAYANLIRRKAAADSNDPYCIIDVGHSATRILIYSGVKLEVTRLIEYGAGMLDRAIAEATGVDEFVARSYKHTNYQDVLSLEGCQSVYQSIALDIVRAISYFGFNSRSASPDCAYICGGGSMIEPLISAITEAASMNMQTENLRILPISEIMPDCRGGSEYIPFCAAAVGATFQ